MTSSYPAMLGLCLCASEMVLNVVKRAKTGATKKDRGSLRAIWIVNMAAVTLAVFAAFRLQSCRLPYVLVPIGTGVFVVGVVLRWYSIFYLGRFFTVNVAILSDHRVVDTGPYRFLRHPSYAGSMLMMLGVAASFHNWASLLILFIPSFAVTLYRIHVEEQALLQGLGEPYRAYAGRTKRLIPFVY